MNKIMPNLIEGSLTTPNGRFAIIAARFNETVVKPLTEGSLEAFRRHGVSEDKIDLIRVPGSFEIPVVAKKLALSKKYVGVICLGCIIRGDTDHYDHVAGAATSGIASAANESIVPVIFGILTCETLEQAVHRAGGKAGNKGFEAAVTAIEMANLMAKIGT
jgi:6,7-dimethyl-8-ribityllumazine synthase